MSELSFYDQQQAQALVECVGFLSQKGWSPATSTNYSIRLDSPEELLISRSGVDKAQFRSTDLIVIDLSGNLKAPAPGLKSSAETEIHTALYRRFPEARCVLHTHSLLGTWLSQKNLAAGHLSFSGWEIQKGLTGITTHTGTVRLPIVPNDQDMAKILQAMEPHWATRPHGFLIAGHGLYTWGKDVAEAKRHIETYEFLFELHRLGA